MNDDDDDDKEEDGIEMKEFQKRTRFSTQKKKYSTCCRAKL